MKSSIKINFIYNSLMMVFNIAFPLITAPYISRILGVEKIGAMNFAASFSNWFVLVSALGFTTYGIREVSRIREDKNKMDKVFSEILSLNIISVILFLGIYFVIILTIPKFQMSNKLFLIYSLNLIFSFSSLDWFYYGIENYEYISKRSLFFKIISLILLFCFVKNEADFYKYVFIVVFGVGASNILNLINSRKYVSFKFQLNFKHIYLSRIFYFQVLLGSVYSVVDQVLLGFLSTNTELGYYSRSRQLIMLGITIILCFVRTITPRLSNLYLKNREEYKKLVNISFKITTFLIFPCMIGILFLSKHIMYLFGGNEFLGASKTLQILTLLLIFTVYATFLDTNLSIPSGNEKNTFYGNLGVAAVSLFLNLILLKKYGAIGAAISICFAECLGLCIQFYRIKKQNLYLEFLNLELLKYILASIIMGLGLIELDKVLIQISFINTLLLVIAGGLLYISSIYFISKAIKSEENEVQIVFNKLRRKK